MEKPITLRKREMTEKIIEAINTSGLHPLIMESVIKELYTEVQNLARTQAEQEERQYYASLEEENNND